MWRNLLVAILALIPVAAQAQERPNIVIIVADDLGWNSVSFHNGFVPTPYIDRIATNGVQLDRFYVAPMCSPTRAALMTGRQPIRYGMALSVVQPWSDFGLPPEEHLLPEYLAEAGYEHRGAFGKWHLGSLRRKWHPLEQGFTRFNGQYLGMVDYWTREREGEVDWHSQYDDIKPRGYQTDQVGDAASTFIANAAMGDAPFFAYVPFQAPHIPNQAPAHIVAKFAHLDDTPGDGKPSAKQLTAAMISSLDDNIGKILSAIAQSGEADNTLIWFMSDNGGVRMVEGTNTPLRGGKTETWEGGIRVPAAVWWPGHIEGGRKISTLAAHVDIMPTIAELAGARLHKDRPLDGRSLVTLLTDRNAQFADVPYAVFRGREGPGMEKLAYISEDGWKLVVIGPDIREAEGWNTPQHQVELFRIKEDPSERNNLAAQYPEQIARLGKALLAFRQLQPRDEGQLVPYADEMPANFKPPASWRIPAE